jgi:putative transposase
MRVAGPELDLHEMFLAESPRGVNKDRTVSLEGVRYEVDAALVGEVVSVRFDASKKGAPVDIWHKGKKVCQARTVDAYANCFVKRNHEPSVDASAPPHRVRTRDLDDKEGR